MRKVMIRWLFSFILLALGAMVLLAVSVAGDIAPNFMSIKIDIGNNQKEVLIRE